MVFQTGQMCFHIKTEARTAEVYISQSLCVHAHAHAYTHTPSPEQVISKEVLFISGHVVLTYSVFLGRVIPIYPH